VENIILDLATKRCTCGPGFYRDGNICLPCHILCSQCNGPTSRDCLPNKCAQKAYPLYNLLTTCLYGCKTPMDDLYIDQIELICKRIFKTF